MSRRRLLGLAGVAMSMAACGSGSSASRGPAEAPGRHVESYGAAPEQVGEWWLPSGDAVAPTVVLVHGGFWRPGYDRHLEDKVAADLANRGYLCWNIDYRPSTTAYPTTLTDVVAAYEHLTKGRFAHRVDTRRVAIVGHSAGGQLAMWLASQRGAIRPAVVVPQAGVVALTRAAREHLGSDAAQALLDGTPKQRPARYREADPVDLVPTHVRSVLVHGSADDVVPLSQSETYLAAAKAAGDDCTLDVVPGDHFVHLDPASQACARMRDALAGMSQ